MKKFLLYIGLVLLVVAAVVGYYGYTMVLQDNLIDSETGSHDLYVKSSWNYDSVYNELATVLINTKSFDRVARKMNLPNKISPGYYQLSDSLCNRDLIRLMRSGQTTDVKVVLTGSLKRKQILPKIAESLEVDSNELKALIQQPKYIDSLGYTAENWPCLFVANTYFFNWATSPKEVIERFLKERTKFWNTERRLKAESLGLSPNEVIVLASIVDAETMMDSELATIAGVYLNRLQQNWPLGADPTIRYLINDQGRQRVLYEDLEIESPYNTYKNLGLPPGPILLPSNKAINAVLNAESTEYMFFCAKADFSGYHAFAKTNAEHERNRAAYRRELNKRGIMR